MELIDLESIRRCGMQDAQEFDGVLTAIIKHISTLENPLTAETENAAPTNQSEK